MLSLQVKLGDWIFMTEGIHTRLSKRQKYTLLTDLNIPEMYSAFVHLPLQLLDASVIVLRESSWLTNLTKMMATVKLTTSNET